MWCIATVVCCPCKVPPSAANRQDDLGKIYFIAFSMDSGRAPNGIGHLILYIYMCVVCVCLSFLYYYFGKTIAFSHANKELNRMYHW